MIRFLLLAVMVAAFVAGFVASRVVDRPQQMRKAAMTKARKSWVAESLEVLNANFPAVFPDDLHLEMGRAYSPEAMRVFVTTGESFLEAKARCREHLPGDWVEVPVDNKSVAFVSSLRGTKQTSILIRDQKPVRYEVSTEGAVHAKVTALSRLDGSEVARADLGRYLIRLQASR